MSIKKAKDRPERPKDNPRIHNVHAKIEEMIRSKDFRSKDNFRPKENFETKMAKFLKDSEDRLSTLKKSTETKRGGRGGRRG